MVGAPACRPLRGCSGLLQGLVLGAVLGPPRPDESLGEGEPGRRGAWALEWQIRAVGSQAAKAWLKQHALKKGREERCVWLLPGGAAT